MKKIIAILLSAVIMVGFLAVPSFATTKADILNEAAKSPVYKYVKVSIENAAKTVTITDAQADQILPLVKQLVALLNKDNGNGVYHETRGRQYDDATVDKALAIVKQICDILGWRFTVLLNKKTVHPGDSTFRVYDENNKLIFTYDGDAVADTSGASYNNAWIAFTAGCAVLVAGAAIVISRKRLICEK